MSPGRPAVGDRVPGSGRKGAAGAMPGGAAPLIPTKLVPPRRRGPVVRRERLSTRFGPRAAQRLTLVLAPAGYGKTELLAQWHEAVRRARVRCGWLSLESADNDPARLVSHLLAALGAGAVAPDGPGGARSGTADVLSDRVLRAFPVRGRLVLFLDDVHLLTEPVPAQALARVIALAPAGVRFALAAREAPAFSLERLRVDGELCELNWSDLRFTPPEATALLGGAESALPPAAADALVERTEGWATGLQLAALFRDGRIEWDAVLARLHGDSREVAGFLAEDVFARLPATLRDFLLATCGLGRMCAGLCDALTDRDDGAAMLAELGRRNLFVFALDGRDQWFRYHHLFAEFLERERLRHWPGRAEELHRRAAQWFQDQGHALEALDHAFATGDDAYAASVLNAHCDALMYSGHLSTVMNYAQRLAPAELARWPRVQLDLAWSYEYEWRFDRAREVLDAVRSTYARSPAARAPAERRLLRRRILHREMMLAFMADDLATADACCRQWQAEPVHDDAYVRASLPAVQVSIRRAALEPRQALDAAAQARPLLAEGRSEFGQVVLETFAGPAYAQLGDLPRAEQHLRGALERAEGISGACSSVAAMPAALLAEVLMLQGDDASAAELIENHRGVIHACGFVDSLVAFFVTAARLEIGDGRVSGAQAVLDEGLELASGQGFLRLRGALLAAGLGLLEPAGAAAQASALAKRWGLSEASRVIAPAGRPGVTQLTMACAQARLALLDNRPELAVPGLVRWRRVLVERCCVLDALRVMTLLVRLHAAMGDERAAQRELREAMATASRVDIARVFLDEGAALAGPLARYCDGAAGIAGEYAGFARKLLEALPGDAHAGSAQPKAGGVAAGESLRAREVEVLRLVGQGLRNEDIAQALGVSANTVKWHLKQAFAKLRVGRRAQAVRAARSARLIP